MLNHKHLTRIVHIFLMKNLLFFFFSSFLSGILESFRNLIFYSALIPNYYSEHDNHAVKISRKNINFSAKKLMLLLISIWMFNAFYHLNV